MEARHMILEINLISAQGLKLHSSNKRRTQTYTLAWIDSSTKLRSRVDRIDSENPTWNDKFLFKVSPEFLASETSAVSIEIFSVCYLRDHLIGSVRFLISNIPLSAPTKTPSFTVLQIRRPSGRVHGLLNIAARLIDDSNFSVLNGVSAIGYPDLMGENQSQRGNKRGGHMRKSQSMVDDFIAAGSGSESLENSSCNGSPRSEGGDSTTSSSSTASTVLKDWNGTGTGTGMVIPGVARKPCLRSLSAGMLCGLLVDRKSRPSQREPKPDQNLELKE